MSRVRVNRTHGSMWQGLETHAAMVVELGTTGKPAWTIGATAYGTYRASP